MAFWEYTLTGFCAFLEQRRVSFVQPMPAGRVCSRCGRVPANIVDLPCGHVICDYCFHAVVVGAACPLDGLTFTAVQLVFHCIPLSDLENRRVFCTVGGRRCPNFAGTLGELNAHMVHCRSVDVNCDKCRRPVASELLVDHYRNCGEGNRAREVPVDRAAEELAGVKADLLLQQTLVDGDDDDDNVNGAYRLGEMLASVEGALSSMQAMADSVHRGSPSSPRKKTSIVGPFRTPSKPDALIATCKLFDVHAARDSLAPGMEHNLSSELYTLAGYTFKLQCNFALSVVEENVEEVNVRFGLFLCAGVWDDFLEWPFPKKVSLTIAHPTDVTKDVVLALFMEGNQVVKKPGSGRNSNSGCMTERKRWKDIELYGYIVRGALYVNVEFE